MSVVEQRDPILSHPLSDLPILLRPFLPIALVALAWAALSATPAILNLGAHWNQTGQGMALWLLLTLGGALPAGLLAGMLSERLERAVTRLDHPGGRAWRRLGAAALVVSHWALHLAWAPLKVVDAFGTSYGFERRLVGAVLASGAWVLVLLAGVVAASAWRQLHDRTWTNVPAAVGTEPWLDSTWVAAALYGTLTWVPAVFVAAFGVVEGAVSAAVGVWMVCGVVLAAPPAALAATIRARLAARRGEPVDRAAARFWEALASLWAVHWGIPCAFVLLPVGSIPNHHPDRLAWAVGTALLLVAAVGVWGVARAHRTAMSTAA